MFSTEKEKAVVVVSEVRDVALVLRLLVKKYEVYILFLDTSDKKLRQCIKLCSSCDSAFIETKAFQSSVDAKLKASMSQGYALQIQSKLNTDKLITIAISIQDEVVLLADFKNTKYYLPYLGRPFSFIEDDILVFSKSLDLDLICYLL